MDMDPDDYHKPLRGLVIALHGDFGERFKHVSLGAWIEELGGAWSKDLTMRTTHFVCSRAAWLEKDTIVEYAMLLSRLWIVDLDWLLKSCSDRLVEDESEYSMAARDAKHIHERRLRGQVVKDAFSAREYVDQPDKTQQPFAEYSQSRPSYSNEFQQGIKSSQELLGSDSFHWYRDESGFVHSIVLSRQDPDINHQAFHDFELHLFESNSGPPFFYAMAAVFRTSKTVDGHIVRSTDMKKYQLTRLNVPFEQAFFAFRLLFRCLTGVDWELRFWVTPNYRLINNGTAVEYLVGNSLHASSPENVEEHRKYWESMQARCPSDIRNGVMDVIQGIFQRKPVEPRPRRMSAKALAKKKKQKQERNARGATIDPRTGKPKAAPVNFSKDLSSSENEEEDEYDLVDHIHSRYFMYEIPAQPEPRGDNTMISNGTRWFGFTTRCEQLCNVRNPAKTMYRDRNVSAATPRKMRVGGGCVEYWDWRMFKEGFKTSGSRIF